MVSNNFRKWMLQARASEKAELAKAAGSSVQMLYQLASGHRNASAAAAARIEKASKGELNVGDICDTCRQCKYFKECKK